MSDLIENIAVCAICTNNQTCGYPRGIKVSEIKAALDVNGCAIECPLTKQNKLDSNGVNLALTAARSKNWGDLVAAAEQEVHNKNEPVNLALEASKRKNALVTDGSQ
mgnify:CR=1 FL=1